MTDKQRKRTEAEQEAGKAFHGDLWRISVSLLVRLVRPFQIREVGYDRLSYWSLYDLVRRRMT